jgi:hypothetical protein
MHISREQTLDFVKEISARHFSGRDTDFIEKAFSMAEDLFEGRHPGYLASDTAYHDFKHTCEATVAVIRILDGHIKGGGAPKLEHRDLELAVVSTLLHDCGFMKEEGDDPGTGAKYTLAHVKRSGDFAKQALTTLGANPDEIRLVRLAIDCTGVQVNLEDLPFRDDRERFLGCALGTGDMLAQMAAPDYPERLECLYREFAEAALTPGGAGSWIASYSSAEDLKRRTRQFWDGYVKGTMLDDQWRGVHKDLNYHFEDGQNHYFDWIETNLVRIDQELSEN